MSECIILIRNPGNGCVLAIEEQISRDGESRTKVYPNNDAARADTKKLPICDSWPYQVVELEI